MSRTNKSKRRGYPVCSGCSACSWFPKHLQPEGKRTLRVERQENEAASELGLIRYDLQSAAE